MHFTSWEFLNFFGILFAVYWLLPWPRARVYLLLAASLYFYASWNKWLALIVLASSVADFLIARGLDSGGSDRRRSALLWLSVLGNLALLGYFKYANFFLQSLEHAVAGAGFASQMPVLKIVVPIGLSFYVFEAISYTVDVYRRRVRAERDLSHFILFITFFPHLVAGPIVRARDFLPQIARPKRWSWPRLCVGLQYVVLGVFKKVAIADRMALYVDPVFADPTGFGPTAVWFAVVAYALQIYCDFSGYTDMALGMAHMLGYKLAPNFNMPYVAANVSEFWHRWHMSLSSWLRDYVFIPLGGSRNSRSRWRNELFTARNLMLTMVLGGLWHGAAWTFVVWGFLHGLFLVVHRAFRAASRRLPLFDAALTTFPGTVLRVGLTFVCVCVGWVFFRAPTFQTAVAVLKKMFGLGTGELGSPVPYQGLAVLASVCLVAHLLGRFGGWRQISARVPSPVLGFGFASAVAVAMVLTPTFGKAFIYFQF